MTKAIIELIIHPIIEVVLINLGIVLEWDVLGGEDADLVTDLVVIAQVVEVVKLLRQLFCIGSCFSEGNLHILIVQFHHSATQTAHVVHY